MDLEERKQLLLSEVTYTVIKPEYKMGGQHCGIKPTKIIGYHESLEIKIESSYHRSNYKNIELIEFAFKSIINEIIK